MATLAPHDPYEAVLADLRAKRDQIDQTIELLTALREGRTPAPQAPATEQPVETVSADTTGMFLGMSIVDATKKLLALRKRAMGNADILTDLRAGGLVLTSNDPLNVVSSVLMRRFKAEGDIVRVDRGVWGLKEWYPGRNFKVVGKNVTIVTAESGVSPPSEAGTEQAGSVTQEDGVVDLA